MTPETKKLIREIIAKQVESINPRETVGKYLIFTELANWGFSFRITASKGLDTVLSKEFRFDKMKKNEEQFQRDLITISRQLDVYINLNKEALKDE